MPALHLIEVKCPARPAAADHQGESARLDIPRAATSVSQISRSERLLVLGPHAEPGPQAVPSAGWAIGWARAARDHARNAVAGIGSTRVHFFIAAPTGLAMMLGHQWNLMPATTIYEHLRPGYTPTLTT
jgi:hypothetical protein